MKNRLYLRRVFWLAALLPLCAAAIDAAPWSGSDWRTADRSSAGLSPLPSVEPGAVVQGFAARAYDWRGVFAVHSWLAVKEEGAAAYKVYQVVGWRLRRGLSAVLIEEDVPDRHWYGKKPRLLFDLRGERAARVIPRIAEAAASYPWPDKYRAWPGPNSNTFVSHILRRVPEMGVELPPNAVGRDWLGGVAGVSETRTGAQVSLLGAAGVTLGAKDGIEINLLGLTFGVDLLRPALKLPLVGRVGLRDK
jgi:hypothetical protein